LSVPKRVYELLAQQIIDDYGITQGRCLDVGAGEGQMGLEIAKISSLSLYLLDVKPESLKRAEEKSSELGLLSRTVIIDAPVERIPFLDEYFDLIISRGSIFFWEDQASGLKEIHRVLRPGGVAFVGGGTSRYMPKKEADEFFAWARESHRKHNPDWDNKSNKQNLIKALERAEISDYDLMTDHGTWIEIKK
jgi:ubiquinone/menaquinone biosynthesis C-methylase UbiE